MIGELCGYCSPCDCECHRHESVYHFMPCCSRCTECGQDDRKQFTMPIKSDEQASKPEMVPTMRLRWIWRRIPVPAPGFGGGVVQADAKFLQQWFEAPADAGAVGKPPGEWRDIPQVCEP